MRHLMNVLATSMAAAMFSMMGFAALSGCDNNRDVIEVETPEGEIDVEQDKDTGAIEIETE